MRILACHVENFGKLHDYSVDFSHGLNTICAENGWGKSTFAAFIRAMFYGLEGERKRSIEENERKRYKPWQGGVFGGQLIFETNGKEYEISRIFHDKEVNDEFELREVKTNLISKDFSKKIGEELFKINRESFIRTIFIGQGACEAIATDDINAKIGEVSENTNDLNSFDAAYSRLTEIMNSLNPGRVTGSISKRRDEITRLDKFVQDGKGIAESIESYQRYLDAQKETYEVLKKQLNETGELQTKVSELQAVANKKSEWERRKDVTAAKKNKLNYCRSKFKGFVPDLTEMKERQLQCTQMEKAKERMSLYQLSLTEQEELDSLENMFKQGIPTDEQVEQMVKNIGEFRMLNQQYNTEQLSAAEKRRLQELENYYQDGHNSSAVIGRWNERNTRKATIPSKQAAITALTASVDVQHSKRTKLRNLLLLPGLLMVAGGGIWLITQKSSLGWILLLLGLLLCIMGIYIFHKKRSTAENEISTKLQHLYEDVEEDENYIAEVDREIESYLVSHGKVFEEFSVSAYLQEIATEAAEYTALKRKADIAREGSIINELEEKKRVIFLFFEKYDIRSNELQFSDDLYHLKSRITRYGLLCEKRNKYYDAEKEYIAERNGICSFLAKYEYVPAENLYDQLADIRDDADAYRDAELGWKEASEEQSAFEAKTDISLFQELHLLNEMPSLEEINQRILQLTEDMEKVHRSILSYDNTLEGLQEKYDEWEENQLKLEELQKIQKEEEIKYNYVWKARVKLGLAKESMTAKYATPILERFCEYFAIITDNMQKQFHIDANTTITIKEQGKQREINTLSAGYRDLVGICMRIALIDVMYQEEMPPIIMDDPFTNFDDDKVNTGKMFLEKIGKKYQIIYFTCSNIRSCDNL